MSNYKGYKPEDNARRKVNNTGDSTGMGPNQNLKCYSSKIGQQSMRAQADSESRKYARLNKKQPLKTFTREEIEATYGKTA